MVFFFFNLSFGDMDALNSDFLLVMLLVAWSKEFDTECVA